MMEVWSAGFVGSRGPDVPVETVGVFLPQEICNLQFAELTGKSADSRRF